MIALIAFAALILVLSFIYLLARRVDLGLMCLLVVQLYDFTFGFGVQKFAGVRLDPLDVVTICLLIAGVIRTFPRLKTINADRFFAIGFLVLFSISILRGLFSIRILSVLNEVRGFTGPLVATLYFFTAPADDNSVRRYTRIYLYFGAALCLVAALAAFGLPVGTSAWAHIDPESVDGRYLPSDAVAAIAVCGFLTLGRLRERGALMYQLLPVLFIATAIYLRHRTIWVMLIVGATALLPLDGRLFRLLLPAWIVAVVAVAGLAMYGNRVEGLPGQGNFSRSASDRATWDWRVDAWRELVLDQQQNAIAITIGKSMGEGYYHFDPTSGSFIDVIPHNEFVQEYLRVGIVGVLFLILFLLRPLVMLWRLNSVNPTAVYPSTSAWVIVVLITLVYGITYPIDSHSYALLGIASAIVLRMSTPQEAGSTQEFEILDTEVAPTAAD